jgi:hypothetical protein
LTPSFAWSIANQRIDSSYCSEVVADKGRDPFDGEFEDVFPAGRQTAVAPDLDPGVYDPRCFEWGVAVSACDAPVACESADRSCRRLVSPLRTLRSCTIPQACASTTCPGDVQ